MEISLVFLTSDADLTRGRGSSQTETMAAQRLPNPKVASATLRERQSKIQNGTSSLLP
ncbi:MAG: hypothetical protein HC899_39860 [Leptolyngbyaceae cyanobacterium SM1_4_3]|nr:hypothetical protein [Leptolyngbyaceae cyanobacterium SM1_4_3]